MKILKLDINAYGPFTELPLDLSKGNHGLHLIFGPNESGKTSLLRAIISFFYGIGQKTDDAFLHEYGALSIGGLLRHSSGKEQYFIRRKGRKNDLLDKDGNPVPESEMKYFLDDVSEDIFINMFGLGSESLVNGGRNLVEGNGEMGSALFSAISGITEISNLLKSIEEEKDNLFKPSGKNQKLNVLLKEYGGLKESLKAASMSSKEWEELDKQINGLTSELERIRRAITENTTLANHKDRLKESFMDANELRRIMTELNDMEGTPLLSEDFSKRREVAELKIKTAEDSLSSSNVELGVITEQLSKLDIPEKILSQKTRITDLFQESGNYRQGKGIIPELNAEVLILKGNADSIFKEIDLFKDDERYSLSIKDKALINSLIDSYPDISNNLKNTEKNYSQTMIDLGILQEKLDEQKITINVNEFEKLLEEFRLTGLSESAIKNLESSESLKHKTIKENIARLGLDEMSFDDFCSLVLPSNETILSFSKSFTEIDQQIEVLLNNQKKANENLISTNDMINTLQFQGVIPSEKDLNESRSIRDQLWQSVKKAWLDGRPISEELWKSIRDDAEHPAEAYEHTVHISDEISDRLRRESDRVITLAHLITDKERGEQTLSEIEEQVQNFRGQRSVLDEQWEKLFQQVYSKPASPAIMGEWLALYSETLGSIREWRTLSEDLNLKSQDLKDYKDKFLTLLSSAAIEVKGLSINELYRKADTLIKEEQGKKQVIKQINETISKTQAKVVIQKKDLDIAREAMDSWSKSWAKAIKAIKSEPSLTLEQAKTIIGSYESLSTMMSDLKAKTTRIEDIKSDNREFEKNIKSLFSDLSLPVPESNFTNEIAQLNSRLVDGISNSTLSESLKSNQAELLKNKALYENTIRNNKTVLEALLGEAHCDDPSQLPECENKSAIYKQTLSRGEDLKRIISRSAGGKDLDSFLSELNSVDIDRLPQEIFDLKAEVQLLESKRDEIIQALAKLEVEKERYTGASEAADIASQIELKLSEIREAAQEYASLTLATARINSEIELYRKKNQGPLLSRAGEILKNITNENIQGLGSHYDKNDNPILVALKNGSKLTVDKLSDGTRDQLYLSLRLASLEQRIITREPMPLITDDILIHFDDSRAIETLKILAELSNKTQIMLFTHHDHIKQLAKKHVDDKYLFIHEML